MAIVTHPAYEQTSVVTREFADEIMRQIDEQIEAHKRECGDKNDKRDDVGTDDKGNTPADTEENKGGGAPTDETTDEIVKKAAEAAAEEEAKKKAEEDEAAKREADAKAKEEQEARELEEQEQRFREQQAMRLRHRAMRLRTEQELESLSY